jgi:hypothetical protein
MIFVIKIPQKVTFSWNDIGVNFDAIKQSLCYPLNKMYLWDGSHVEASTCSFAKLYTLI